MIVSFSDDDQSNVTKPTILYEESELIKMIEKSSDIDVWTEHNIRKSPDYQLKKETYGVDIAGNGRYFCPTCSVKYTEIKYLKTHMKNCGKKFVCDLCHQTYKQKRTFAMHIKKKHSVEYLLDESLSSFDDNDHNV